MTKLYRSVVPMPAANLGKNNPLPDIKSLEDQHAKARVDDKTVSAEESKYMGWGRVKGILPYTIQDGYDRKRDTRELPVFILENDHLKATFLPELGGRLYSLEDKHTGRELLHKNPVFQPCNLALRNAWISGGVEWNCGIIGHSPYTVDKLFARQKTLKDGTPVLSLYQYERVRGLVYRVEAMLPKDARQLFIRVRIDNCKPEDTAVYWWSNIAVDERLDVRVIVPAEKAFHFGSEAGVHKVSVPFWEDSDVSLPTSLPYAMDFFFDIKDGRRRFIASPGEDGYGLVQTSTDRLRGRKLFVWGQGAGGKRWQTFLSQPGSAYIEIQAGLARTQLEHLPMKAGESITWMEAYGALQSDPKVLAGNDWDKTVQEVETRLERALPRAALEEMEKTYAVELDNPEGWEQVALGDGWARLEKDLLEDGFDPAGLDFPESSLNEEHQPWLQLLHWGYMKRMNPLKPPVSYQVGPKWRELLLASIATNPKANHWFSWYHLGVMACYAGEAEEAKTAFERANALTPSPWATWCLAILEEQHGRLKEAADYALKALALLPHRAIAVEALRLLNKAGEYDKAVETYDALPMRVKALGRSKASLVAALLKLGDLERARRVLLGPLVLADVREGEVSLSALWFELKGRELAQSRGENYEERHLQEAKAGERPPKRLDFRMKE